MLSKIQLSGMGVFVGVFVGFSVFVGHAWQHQPSQLPSPLQRPNASQESALHLLTPLQLFDGGAVVFVGAVVAVAAGGQVLQQ